MAKEDVEDEEVLTQEPPQQQESITISRTRWETWKPVCFSDMVAYAFLVVDKVLFTYRETVENSKNEKWKRVMDDKMQSL